MANVAMKKYYVKNLDCAACAAKIERGLQQVDGVKEVTLDFANLMLHVTADDMKKVIDEIHRIEPGVEIIPEDKKPLAAETFTQESEFKLTKEIGLLSIATILFCIQLFFEGWMHQSPFAKLELVLVFIAYLLAGWKVFQGAFRTIQKGAFFDENVLMVIATGGAIAIHAYSEAIGVMIFYKVGELLQEMAVSRSRRSIRSLLAAKPNKALVKTPDGFSEIAPELVKIGDIIVIKPGEKIPLDGEVLSGKSQLDSSALTGESVPVTAEMGDAVMAGQINQTGALTVRVSRLFKESSIAKVMDMVENATARKAHTEKFMTTFARYYTPVVVVIAAVVAFVPPLVMNDALFSNWVYRALVLLVISCPCALVVSIPLGYFGGIGRASRSGILIKGSMFIDALAQVKTVVFDKTGTLTRGVFKVNRIVPSNGHTSDQVLEYAAAVELHSDHPIGQSIVKAMKTKGLSINEALVKDHVAFSGMGARATYDGKVIAVGNDALLHNAGIDHGQCAFESTVAHVVVDDQYAGYLLIGDQLKPDAKQAVDRLRRNGVEKLVMLTGDNEYSARHVANALGLDQFHAGLLPEDKVRLFEQISLNVKNDGKVAFVGDGINDAPVLARADVGVAMGGLGSDAAIETADVVLMADSPSKMAEAVSIARQTRRIVWQNIALALSVKSIFVLMGAFGLATMWEAVFADVGTALIALVNATRAFRKKPIVEGKKTQ
jgi:Zn2+/Cd2+-exporting ATPase